MLWLTAEVPDAGLSGGNIRQYHLLQALAGRAGVDLVAIGPLRDEALRGRLGRVIELPEPQPQPVRANRVLRRVESLWTAVAGRFPYEVSQGSWSRDVLAPFAAATASYDVVCVEHAQLAPLLPRQRSNRWLLTLHNVGSERSRQMAAVTPGSRQAWLWSRDAAKARRLERWALRAYDQVIAVSDDDAQRLGDTAVVIPNGVDLARFRFTPLPAEPRLLFTANFNYPPNVDATRWLGHEIFPRVRSRVPDATLALVGRRPVRDIRELARLPGISLHADVDSVVPHLEAARVAVVPVRVGTGTRLKALEAMAAGRPVAGTSIGLEGLGVVDGESAAVGDDADALADGIVTLLTDDARARAQAAAARRKAERFGWDSIASRFVDTVLGLAAPTAVP